MELPPANDRAIKTTRSNGMKLRLIETRLLTVKNDKNVNAFHGNESKEHMRYKADTTPPRSRTQNISLCFLISKKKKKKKKCLSLPYISPVRILQSVFYTQTAVRSPQSVFYTDRQKFIHTHNLLHYYKVGDQASVEVEGVEEQMFIFLSSLTPGRVKGF